MKLSRLPLLLAASLVVCSACCAAPAPTGDAAPESVTAHGVQGDGKTDALDALTRMRAATPPGSPWRFAAGSYLIGRNFTFEADRPLEFAEGARLRPAAGVTVTVRGPLPDARQPLFDLSLGGKVSFVGNNRVERLDPHWWGAAGDGSADDTAAIQAAIDAAEEVHASAGRTLYARTTYAGIPVFLPQGIYRVTTLTLRRPVHLVGAGKFATVLHGVGEGEVIRVRMALPVEYQGPSIERIGIYGTQRNRAQHGIKEMLPADGNPGHLTVVDCLIQYCGGSGVYFSDDGVRHEVRDCILQYNGDAGIRVEGKFNTDLHLLNNIVRRNRMGIVLAPSASSATGRIADNIIESNSNHADPKQRTNFGLIGASAAAPGDWPSVGLWIERYSNLTVERNYFEGNWTDVYVNGGTAGLTFRSNHHDSGGMALPGTGDSAFNLSEAPVRPYSAFYVTTKAGPNVGMLIERDDFAQPRRPSTVTPEQWGTSYAPGSGAVRAVAAPNGVTLAQGDADRLGIVAGKYVKLAERGTSGVRGLNGITYRVQGVTGDTLALYGANFTGTLAAGAAVGVQRVADKAVPEMYEHFITPLGTQATLRDNWTADATGQAEGDLLFQPDPYGHITFYGTRDEGGYTKARARAYQLDREATQNLWNKAAVFLDEGTTDSVTLHEQISPPGAKGDYLHRWLSYKKGPNGALAQNGQGWGLDSAGNFSIPLGGKRTYQKAGGAFLTEDWGPAPPTAGAWTQGSIRFNTAPSPGSPVGWVCVADGTPGQWEPFGGRASGGRTPAGLASARVDPRSSAVLEASQTDAGGAAGVAKIGAARSPYTLGQETVLLVDASAGPVVVRPPAAKDSAAGKSYTVKKIDRSANPVTFEPGGAETVDGAPALRIAAPWAYRTVTFDGKNWFVTGGG